MKKIFLFFIFLLPCFAYADETLIFMRHAEKPQSGLGQLDCQGFNRSIELPTVLKSKFGKPDLIMASNPSFLKNDHTGRYYYIRPLATIEPTAILFNMPINLAFGFKNYYGMERFLLSPENQNNMIFISWEHHFAEKIVKDIFQKTNPSELSNVPNWNNNDYDSLYVIKIHYVDNVPQKADFQLEHEHLNNLPKTCENQ
jgi:hypothetical protein